MNILAELKRVKACFFDVDGVFTDGSVTIFENGEQVRTFNIKDGLAVVKTIKAGIPVVIISAGRSEGVRRRFEYLGVKDCNLAVTDKISLFEEKLKEYNVDRSEVLYMGDDLPDLKILSQVGMPVCPKDAADDVLPVAKYISSKDGGKGAVREILEKLLRVQGLWGI